MAKKGRWCIRCNSEVRDVELVEKPGRWMERGVCGVCGAHLVFTKGRTWIEQERRAHGRSERTE